MCKPENKVFMCGAELPEISLHMPAKGDQDIVITLSTEDFLVNRQKKKNLIEMVGFKFERHGSTLTEPIILKSITVKLE